MPTEVGKRAGKAAAAGLLVLVMLLSLTACGGGKAKVLGGQSGDITVDETFRFDPDKVEIGLNRDVFFSVVNKDKDKRVHNVTIPALFIDMDVQPGQRVEIKIPAVSQAPRDGFFSFYCKYHQSQGESGRINVR